MNDSRISLPIRFASFGHRFHGFKHCSKHYKAIYAGGLNSWHLCKNSGYVPSYHILHCKSLHSLCWWLIDVAMGITKYDLPRIKHSHSSPFYDTLWPIYTIKISCHTSAKICLSNSDQAWLSQKPEQLCQHICFTHTGDKRSFYIR